MLVKVLVEDAGLRDLLALLQKCDVHVRILNLNGNRLTEVLMEHNRVQADKAADFGSIVFRAGNMIERPMQVTQLVKEAFDNRFPSTFEERQFWEVKQQCPPLQLPRTERCVMRSKRNRFNRMLLDLC
ncbi:unnamed protein product [Symbiodinium natans]|uniref:Uncharacterized protein n=1 Tax=Symbiodinium natans TaxID=878477 RepID=A0A812MQ33_9DINO|nr:unnamed protein product [Symbiodinium natans]